MTTNSMPPTVAVLGGDPVVGRAIEALLLNAGYGAISFAVPPTNGSRHLLDEARVLLLAPGIGAEEREAFLAARGESPTVELLTILDKKTNKRSGSLSWPSGAEEIGKEIDAALLNAVTPVSSAYGALGRQKICGRPCDGTTHVPAF